MPLLPLLIPFLLLAFLLFMERVEDVLLGQHPDEEEEAARLQRDTEAGQARAVARPAERVPHRGDAGRTRSSSTSGRSGRTLRTRRLLEARDRADRLRPVLPVDGAGAELHRKSA